MKQRRVDWLDVQLRALSSHRYTEATMTSKMVIHQPQPVMVARESEEWSSGICDCCDDVPQCKCICV
ncbi:hypothetical protein EPR50_G00141940 [Perca flavescens]|uniref:Uncharacterized protein n=1 Tax=Perca flavescens TaxID=8167 RepID=A0A484CNG0_PERFV|nr:hypothetical protein EPR50_G00141940 [Perca flavescens]